jgi:5-methylcytosine-specific restriction endonuclease McrA
MRKKDKNFKIQYKVDDKILSLRFETIQDFLETVFPKNNNPLSPTNDTELLSVTWHKQQLFEKSYKLGEVKTLLKDFNPTKLLRKETYSIEEVRDKVKDVLFEKDKRLAKVDFDGDLIKGNSQRYQTFFTKGCKCVVCGIEGKYFAKERHLQDKTYHLNLYAVDDNGEEILMTKDHILPRSKGGIDDISNYQTMCKLCNEAKGNKLED